MGKIRWTEHVRNEEVLLRVKEQRNILHERKDKRGIEVTGRQGRRRRTLLDDVKERRGYSHLKEEALERTMCRGFVLEEALDLS